MSNYNKATNFAVKDTLTSGDPDKVVSGAEIDNEFNSISSAIGSKIDKVSAATTNNLAALNANGNVIDSGFAGTATVPAGGIIMWSGLISAIPTGWSLCDGTNGTPDLRNRFVVGAGDEYDRNETGGSKTTSTDGSHTHVTDSSGSHSHGGNTQGHQLTIAEMPAHSHSISFDREQTSGSFLGGDHDRTDRSTSTGSTGGNQAHSHGISSDGDHTHNVQSSGDHTHTVTPPYFALAYIMKL